MSRNTDRCAELHEQFQEAHSTFHREGAGLYLAHWDSKIGEEASVAKVWNGPFQVIGTFSIPIISAADVEFFEITMLKEPGNRAVGQGRVGRRMQRESVAFIPSPKNGDIELANRGSREFRRLAEAAGQVLPKSIRDVLPWQFEPREFAGRWLGAMFWHKPPEAWKLLAYNRPRNGNGYERFEFQPFSESADVIEDFGMLTESPQFRTTDGHWPVWAGFSPFNDDVASGTPTRVSPVGSADGQEAAGGERPSEPKTSDVRQKPVNRPTQKAIESVKQFLVTGNQTKVAEVVYGDRKKQYQVSRDLKAVENYCQAIGIPTENWLAAPEKPEFVNWDSETIDLGRRRDGRTERQREKFEEND